MASRKIALVANTDWYLYNFRLSLAKALLQQGWEVIFISPNGRYAPLLEGGGFTWQEWRLERRSMNPWRDASALAHLWRLYRQGRPDIVHHFTIKPVLYGSIAAWLSGVPAVVNAITGLGYLFLDNRLTTRLVRSMVKVVYRWLFSQPRTVAVFENESNRLMFIHERLIPEERSFLIEGVGVDVDRFFPSPEPQGIPVVLFPARLLWEKGVGTLVEAARLLKPHRPLRIVLAGDVDPGNPGSVSVEQVRAWEADGLIEWWGWRSDMPAVYRQSNLVVLPSFGEGLPTALLEAGACGRAVVTTDAPGCRDVIEDGYNGLLVALDDAAALAEAMQRLLDDPILRQQMGSNGRRRVEERFSDRRIIAQTLALYERLLR